MMRRLRPAWALTVSLAIMIVLPAAALVNSPAPAGAQQPATILALGDSVAAGLSSSLPRARGYPALLRDLVQAEARASGQPGALALVNLAEPGETVQSFIDDGQLDEAEDWLNRTARGDADVRLMTLTLGGNELLDLWDLQPGEREDGLEQFEEEFGEAVARLSAVTNRLEIDVVVTTYYDLTEGDPALEGSDAWWLARFNDVIREHAAQPGWRVVDLEPVFRGRIRDLTWYPADVHPNNAGHREIAAAIWSTLDYDTDAPAVAIERPVPGDVVSRTPTIRVSASDNVGVSSVDLVVDGDVVDSLIYVPGEDAFIGVWDARDYPESEALLEVSVRDLAENETRASVAVALAAR